MLNKQELKQEGIKEESSVEAKGEAGQKKPWESTMAESLIRSSAGAGEKDRSSKRLHKEHGCMHWSGIGSDFGAEKCSVQ